MAHEHFMQRCFQLALNGLGNVAPNPLVGAVLVHEGIIIGEGFHARYGGPHAEVMAVRNCRRPELLPEATLYVNLEPCSHFGKTPPCTDLILEQRIPRVVVCNTDPFPQVAGRGIQKLRDAGTEVTTGVLEAEGEYLNRRFFTFHRKKRPFVILKWAQSADGFLDGTGNIPVKITGPLTDQRVHQWRTQEAAILVGYRTALKDNPRLTARLFPGNNPLRIVADPLLALPAHLHLFSDGEPTLILNTRKNADEGPVRYRKPEPDTPKGILHLLYRENISSLIVEGGARTSEKFIAAGLWDEARIITGSVSVGEGVAAPLLTHGTLIHTDISEGDVLRCYTHQHTTVHD